MTLGLVEATLCYVSDIPTFQLMQLIFVWCLMKSLKREGENKMGNGMNFIKEIVKAYKYTSILCVTQMALTVWLRIVPIIVLICI